MKSSDYSVILFFSTNYAIRAESVLKKGGIMYKMIPVPRHLSSDCGYSVRIDTKDTVKAKNVLKKYSVEYDRIEKLD
jgi:hypothetical protein